MMEVDIGKHVVTSEGEKAGEISHIVVDSKTQAVTHVVVSKGWLLPRDIVVPIEDMTESAHGDLQLRLDKEQLDALPDFIEMRYVGPEDVSTAEAYVPPSLLYAPMVPGVGLGWNLPSDYMPPGQAIETEENVPEGSVTLSEGMDVLSGEHKVGTLAGVLVHPQSERVSHLVISKGWLLPDERLVPRSAVDLVDEYGIHLRVSPEEVKAMPHPAQ